MSSGVMRSSPHAQNCCERGFGRQHVEQTHMALGSCGSPRPASTFVGLGAETKSRSRSLFQAASKVVKKKCPVCHGNKVSRVAQTLHVELEQGTAENYRIVFDMEADQSPDLIPGDVIFTVQTAPHSGVRWGARRPERDNYVLCKVTFCSVRRYCGEGGRSVDLCKSRAPHSFLNLCVEWHARIPVSAR